jgi:hypothetical protein
VVKIMANEQNLMSPQDLNARLTPEERKANASKAGKASGQARRENKLIKDRILERMGESDWDTMIDNLIARASEDTKFFEVLRDTIGQKPKDSVEVQGNGIEIRVHNVE